MICEGASEGPYRLIGFALRELGSQRRVQKNLGKLDTITVSTTHHMVKTVGILVDSVRMLPSPKVAKELTYT